MRNLDFTDNSPQSIKLGDSNDVLSLKVTESNQPVDLSKVSSITVKIGNTLGYLTEINVDVASLQHPTDGIIDVVVNSNISSKLPAGSYLLEVWINDAKGNTVIYPDTSYPTVIGFSIEKNIMTATSTVITTLTLADFKTKFDEMQEDLQYKAASGYFKGDKGDPGDQFSSVSIYVNNKSYGQVFNIDSINMTLTSSGCYANYGNHSDLIPTISLSLKFINNIIYYDFKLKVLGVAETFVDLTTDQTLIGTISQDLSVIDLKVTNYSIDGVQVRPYIREKFINHNVYYYGDATLNLDNATAYFTDGWLNFDFGVGCSTTATSLNVSTNKIIYFDLLDNSFKAGAIDYYQKITDSQIFLGYFDANSPEYSFFANFSRVLIVKDGVTYAADEYKARISTLSNVYMATLGDSITSDQVSGTGTQIMNALGAKNSGNFATGWSTASDWHNGDTNTTTVTLTTPNNTDTNDNVLSNQVRRALQYTTASGKQITWTHPIDGTFSLDTTLGTGLGNTDKIPSVIYIAISTNDGKNDSVPIVDDTETVFSQNYKDLTRNSIASGLRWAIETLQSAYPGVKIFIASPLQARGNSWIGPLSIK